MAIEQRVLSREDLIERLQGVAVKLGRQAVARADFIRETGLSEGQVMKHFDSWNEFVEAAGLQPHITKRRLDDDELFAALRDAYLEAGAVVPRVRLRKLL